MAMRDLIPFSRQQANAPSLWRESDLRQCEFGGLTADWPNIDVKNKENEVVVTAEVPGMTDKDVELFVDNGMLTIRGEKKGEKDEKGYSECFYGRFERQIPLPNSVDEQHCKAEFHEGLLSIHLPKTREAEEARKKIPINADTRH